jgi:hypothetical protein
MPIQEDVRGSGGWRRIASMALTVGAVSVTIIAVGLVIGLFVWVHSLPDPNAAPSAPRVTSNPANAAPPRREAAAHEVPAARPAAPAARAAAPAAPNAAQRNAAAVAAARAANPAQAPPPDMHHNSDAERNRALGQALSQVGDDPETARRLGAPQ